MCRCLSLRPQEAVLNREVIQMARGGGKRGGGKAYSTGKLAGTRGGRTYNPKTGGPIAKGKWYAGGLRGVKRGGGKRGK